MIKISELLCSHFNTEDGRKYTFLALCFIVSKKVKMQLKCKKKKKKRKEKKKICAMYGEVAVTDRTCQKEFAKFLGTTDILAK